MKLNVPTAKRITAYPVTAFMLAVISLFSITSCGRKVMTDLEAAQWIAAYTPPHLDMDSKIRIEMTDAMKSKIASNEALSSCFDFLPSVKGNARLSPDGRFIDFIREKSLKQRHQYECRINMGKLIGVDSLGDFRFDFFVDKKELRFKDVSVAVDPDDISLMSVSGLMEYNVRAGDSITADRSIIICSDPSAEITVAAVASGMTRRFTITGLKRKSNTTYAKISTNPMSGFPESETQIEIPAIEDFRLINSERIEAAEPYINLDFSSLLSSQQELEGLITIDNIGQLRIIRDGCNVKVFCQQNGLSDITLRLSDLIKSQTGRALDEDIELHFSQELIPPAVEIPFDATILPDNNNLILPFRAFNLAAVDVEVVRIFPENVMVGSKNR